MIKIDVNNNNHYFGKFEITSEQDFDNNAENVNKREDNLDALCSALFYIIDSASKDGLAAERLSAALNYARAAIPISGELIDSTNAGISPEILQQGDHFLYNNIEFICLDVIDGNYLAITADCWCEKRFNEEYEDGCNNWEKSTLRRFLNEDVLEEHFDTKHLVKQTSDLIADNGDKAYGICEDYITLLTCDQYRKYRDYVPLFEECMWTLTPWRCDTDNYNDVRDVGPTGAIYVSEAHSSHGLAPVCNFNSSNLILRHRTELLDGNRKKEE